jgi:hypothetical protein
MMGTVAVAMTGSDPDLGGRIRIGISGPHFVKAGSRSIRTTSAVHRA